MSVKSVFDNYAAEYDANRRKLISCFDDFYAAAVDCIPFSSDRPLRVLDLGAGTGLLSEMVAARFPEARVTLVDIAPNMLEKAMTRLGPYGDRFEFLTADYARNPVEGRYDVIISALSIHHLESDEKCRLFSHCYGALDDGGLFINADQARGVTPAIDRRYREKWIEEVRANGLSEADLQAAFERMREDRMSTLPFQLAALVEAGFLDVNCWYKNNSFVVYSGRNG
jgi:tRNA (cmo5U34)-methyltransferase